MSLPEQAPYSPLPVVLVVEDDPATVDLLQEVLAPAGYRVEYAPDGRAGLARLQAGGVDLVLLDVHLPELSGLDLCRAVRAAAGADDGYLPIIMVTAMVNAAARCAGFAAGADDYVLKPFDLQELLARIAVWLRVRQQVQTAQAMQEALHAMVRPQIQAPVEATHPAARELAERLGNLLTATASFLDLLQEDSLGLTARQGLLLADARRGLAAAFYTVEQFQQGVLVRDNGTPGALAAELEGAAGRGSPSPHPTVLLVEDDAAVSEVLANRFTRDGYAVLHAWDGLEGLYTLDEHVLQRNRRCVVLLDLMLPEVGGLGILEHLRGAPHRVPVVAMSASTTHLVDAWAAGADALVSKPFDLDHLVEVVARYCPPIPR
jgi:DNA-binding response OmpR family regulator